MYPALTHVLRAGAPEAEGAARDDGEEERGGEQGEVRSIFICFQLSRLIYSFFFFPANETFILCHRSQQFEAEQAELHQKLAALQKELVVLKQQYDLLLQQVGQQHSLIQQLSESQPTQISGDKISCMESEDTETGGEFRKNVNKNLLLLEYEYI